MWLRKPAQKAQDLCRHKRGEEGKWGALAVWRLSWLGVTSKDQWCWCCRNDKPCCTACVFLCSTIGIQALGSGGYFMIYFVWNTSRKGGHPHWHNYVLGPLREWFLLIKWHLLPETSQSWVALYHADILAHPWGLSLLLLIQVGAETLNSSPSSPTHPVCL